jgi:hypothetical protein
MPVITITPIGHNLWGVEEGSAFAGALRWHGEHMRLTSPEGEHLGDLFRSDGKIVDGQTVYTWRGYLREGDRRGREVARRASQEDAVAAILGAGKAGAR